MSTNTANVNASGDGDTTKNTNDYGPWIYCVISACIGCISLLLLYVIRNRQGIDDGWQFGLALIAIGLMAIGAVTVFSAPLSKSVKTVVTFQFLTIVVLVSFMLDLA